MACHHHHWNVFPWNCSPASQSLCLKLLHVPSYELEDQDKEQTVTAQLRQPMAPMKELMVWQTLSSLFCLALARASCLQGSCSFVQSD